jgi:RNA polymerase sigma factor (sigma-70 family)
MENSSPRGPDPGIEALLEQHIQDALAYVKQHADPLILQHESSADIVQSVYREILTRREDFEWRGQPAFRKLLFRRLLSKLIDRKLFYQRDKRDARRTRPLPSPSQADGVQAFAAPIESPSQFAIEHEDLERFQRCFDKLPPDYQLVIQRSRLDGCTHDEIAAELGRERGAIKVLLHRALMKLGVLMDGDARGQ